MKDRSNDPSHHEQKLLPQSYISLRTWRIDPTTHRTMSERSYQELHINKQTHNTTHSLPQSPPAGDKTQEITRRTKAVANQAEKTTSGLAAHTGLIISPVSIFIKDVLVRWMHPMKRSTKDNGLMTEVGARTGLINKPPLNGRTSLRLLTGYQSNSWDEREHLPITSSLAFSSLPPTDSFKYNEWPSWGKNGFQRLYIIQFPYFATAKRCFTSVMLCIVYEEATDCCHHTVWHWLCMTLTKRDAMRIVCETIHPQGIIHHDQSLWAGRVVVGGGM